MSLDDKGHCSNQIGQPKSDTCTLYLGWCCLGQLDFQLSNPLEKPLIQKGKEYKDMG